MKPGLRVGLEHELRYRVPAAKTVPALYPESAEFRQMPAVFATGFLVGLLEWACMRAVNPFLDRPRQLTLGTRIAVTHCAPTPAGLEVLARARLTEVDGRRLTFDVQAHDGVEIISRGTHERFIVERVSFGDKVARKARQTEAPPDWSRFE